MTFADFELDPASGELRRAGALVKLRDLPFRVLVVLVERAGQVVTRDQLRAALWGAGTFVDAEAGLNTAIAKLREALGDSAEQPRFIQTLPKRGYRFIAGGVGAAPAGVVGAAPSGGVGAAPSGVVEAAPPGGVGAAPSGVVEAAPSGVVGAAPPGVVGAAPAGVVEAAPPGGVGAWLRRPLVVATVLVLVALGVGLWRTLRAPQTVTIAVVLFHNETGDAQFDQLAQQLTDGTVVALTANPAYAVIGNAAILRTPRIFADIQKIGTELRADYLVLGQLQRVDGRVIARGHFIRVLDQKHLWAKGIDGEPSGLETLVPQTIADAVDKVLSAGPQ